MLGSILEIAMLVCFGMSWPINAYKAWQAKTAKGANLVFYLVIMLGYACGIASKFATHNVTFVLAAYLFNFILVGFNVGIYFRNRNLDRPKAS
jgi:hypothetical protein